MKVRLAAAFILLLAVPGEAQEREPAPPPQDPSVATIRGDIESSFLESISTRVVAIDGQLIFGPEKSCKQHELKPGPHSLVIAYKSIHFFPLRVDATPGATYVVKWREGVGGDTVFVEDEGSGNVVASFPQFGQADESAPVYTPPSGDAADLATIRADQLMGEGLLGEHQEGTSAVLAIDGAYVTDGTGPIVVEPGVRAIVVNMQDSTAWGSAAPTPYVWTNFPLLIDAKPGHTYIIKHGPMRRNAQPTGGKTTIWVEDETEGKEITPRIPIAMNMVNGRFHYYGGVPYDTRSTFPDKKGSRPPPKPKLWCERG